MRLIYAPHRVMRHNKQSAAHRKCQTGRQRRPSGRKNPHSAAHYIASLTAELAKIARRNGLDALSHLLEMARLEADQATKDGPSEPP